MVRSVHNVSAKREFSVLASVLVSMFLLSVSLSSMLEEKEEEEEQRRRRGGGGGGGMRASVGTDIQDGSAKRARHQGREEKSARDSSWVAMVWGTIKGK